MLTISRDYQGYLVRNGVRWPLLVSEVWPFLMPIDELHVGDRLELPETGGELLLQVVLRQPKVFRDAYPTRTHRGIRGDYVLQARVRCPGCERHTTHPIIVIRPEDGHCSVAMPFGRECTDCGHNWTQTGRFPRVPTSEQDRNTWRPRW